MHSLQHLHRDAYRRWACIAAWVALIGYAAVMVANLALLPGRILDIATQGSTVLLAAGALVLIRFGRVGAGAALVVAGVWMDLHIPVFFRGLEPTSLLVVPALVVAAALVWGGRGAYGMAAVSGVTNVAATVVSHRWAGVPNPDPSREAYLLVVAVASFVVTAVLVHVGLQAFGRVVAVARRNEERVARLVAQTPVGIVALEPGGAVLSANPAAEDVLGFPVAELAGRPFRNVLRGLVRDAEGRREVDRILAGDAEDEVTLGLSAGRDLAWVRVRATPGGWEGEGGGLQLLLEDVTERLRSQEEQRLLRLQLEHAQRLEAMGRLVGGIAHDFNNLLTAVGGAAELLLEEEDEDVRELAMNIHEAQQRGSGLVQQLLAFARKEILQPRSLALDELVEEARPLLERILGESVSLEVELDREAPAIVADHGQVEQVLVNLVSNAKDATSPGGRVRIAVRESPAEDGGREHVELVVEDDGVGMDPDVQRRAFEPFFTTKPRGRGTGLGLATVHGIVHQNGGGLHVESEPGAGTRVAVRWPVEAGGSSVSEQEHAVDRPGRTDGSGA